MEHVELRIILNGDRKLMGISRYANNLDTIKENLNIFTAFLMFADQYSYFLKTINTFSLDEIEYTLDDEPYKPTFIKVTDDQKERLERGEMSPYEIVLCVVREEFKQVLSDHEEIVYKDIPKIISYLRENNLIDDIIERVKEITLGNRELDDMIMKDLTESLKVQVDE